MQVGNLILNFPTDWNETIQGTRSIVQSDDVEVICSAARILLEVPDDPAEAVKLMRLKTISHMERLIKMDGLDPNYDRTETKLANGEMVVFSSLDHEQDVSCLLYTSDAADE